MARRCLQGKAWRGDSQGNYSRILPNRPERIADFEINEIDETDSMDSIDKTDQTGAMDPTDSMDSIDQTDTMDLLRDS